MNRLWFAILVTTTPFWAANSHALEGVKVFDVTSVACQSGSKPDYTRVFPAGAVVQMKQDVVEAFANANSDRDSVILRYPIKKDIDMSVPPPCKPGDVLIVEMKKHPLETKEVATESDI
jgi:hypothetical protein